MSASNYTSITRPTTLSGVLTNENYTIRAEKTQPSIGFVSKSSSNQAYLGVIPYNFSESPNVTEETTDPSGGGGGSGTTDDDNDLDDITGQVTDETKQGAAAELFKRLFTAFKEEYWIQNRSKIIGFGAVMFVALSGILLLAFGRKKKEEE